MKRKKTILTKAEITQRLDTAAALAVQAGQQAFAQFRGSVAVELKADGDAVTAVDRANEQFLRRKLADAFPADAVLGEEGGGTLAGGPTWVVDPIDGTSNFAHGIAHWCVSIGLLLNHEPTLGVVYDPCADELFTGLRGEVSRVNGRPLCSRLGDRLEGAVVGIGLVQKFDPQWTLDCAARLLAAGSSVRVQGAGALTLCHVAAGRLDAFVEVGIHLWDVAAAIPVLEGAGARFTSAFDPTQPLAPFSLRAASAKLWAQFDELVDSPDKKSPVAGFS